MALYRSHEGSLTIAGKRVRLCANDDYLWERVGETAAGRGLHEAPQVLQRNGRTFIVYSCSGSWQPTYKLGLLALRPGGDPLNPSDWTKHPQPVFQPNRHHLRRRATACFVKSPDGTEDWILYHAKMDRQDGWRRAIHAQPFRWTPEGLPDFGSPLPSSNLLPRPAGEGERIGRRALELGAGVRGRPCRPLTTSAIISSCSSRTGVCTWASSRRNQ